MKYIIVSILLIVSVQAYGQITVNTNFLPNIAAPMDLRQKITTLADTSTITFQYLGAVCYVGSKDSIYYKGVNGWKPINTGGSGSSSIDSTVVSAGTGISVVQSPANTFTVTNTSPDQTVSITGAGITSITGTYPNFTATSTEVDGLTDNEGSLTVGAGTGTTSIINSNTSGSTGVTIAAGTGLGITESGNVITLTNSSPNVTTDLTITGASSPYTINSSDGTDVTVAQGTGIGLSRSSNQLTITNAAPDQVVTISGATGTYPNFTLPAETGDISAVTVSAPITGGGTSGSVNIGIDTTSITGAATNYDLTLKQNTLVSGTNIKTVNGNTLLGSGNVTISTVDSTVVTSGTGISVSESPANTFTVVNTAPNVTTDLTFTGASSPYTLNSSDGTDVTIAQGTGIGIARSSNQLTITNSSPDQTVSITGSTGTYPNFTVVPESTTVTDGSTIDLTKTTYDITAEVKSNSIDSTHIKTSGIGTTDIADGVVKFAKLQNSGVSASTYNNVTVNNKGIVTNGSNVSYLTSEVDGSLTNEIQDLSLSGNTLSLSSDATTVNLAPYLDNVTTNLSVTGTSSPLTLNSSDGTDVTITAGTNVTLSGSSGNITINATDTNSGGTVTSVNGTGGTGISVTGGPITNSGSLTITNTAPDQVVTITGATGTYPNFTLPTYDDGQTLTLLDSINRVFRLAISGGNTVSFKDQGITTEVDGLVDNEGKLSVGIGGANSSSIQSNSFGSNTITIAGSGGIGVSETGNTITLVNNIADSTIVSAGYGIDVSEFPTNTYTVKADTAEVATPYDLTLKQNTLVSGTNIKTVNGNSLLGSGNVSISTIDSTAYFDPYIIGSDTVGVILQESQDTVHFITTESTVVPESTTVSDSGTIDLTKTGYDISGVVVDGSITPAKLDRAYLTAYTENDPTIASQSGNNGKYLTTNGTTTSWATVVNGTADSTTVVNSYGTIITESPANQFNVKVDSTKFATAYDISQKQDLLISGTNIKTVNGTSLLGSGNIAVGGTTHWASLNYGSSLYGNTQTLTADANTTINFLGSSESSSSVIDANHSNDEIEFVEAGTYRIDYKVNFSANADGLIYANVYSSTLADYITPLKYEGETDSGYKNTIMATSYIYTATAGEKIKLQVYPIGVTHTSANIQAYFIVTKL
jgi:hypothetical protein